MHVLPCDLNVWSANKRCRGNKTMGKAISSQSMTAAKFPNPENTDSYITIGSSHLLQLYPTKFLSNFNSIYWKSKINLIEKKEKCSK